MKQNYVMIYDGDVFGIYTLTDEQVRTINWMVDKFDLPIYLEDLNINDIKEI